MANKYLYWNSESNSGTTFNYSRKISTSERESLIPGKTMIFGITYQSTSGASYPAVMISNLKLCSTVAITATEIPRSESLETVNGKQIVTKYFSSVVPELTADNYTLSFSLGFNSSATILDCALFQGSVLSMKNTHEVDKFSQLVKYDGSWKIRTGTGDNDFVELTTNHSTKNTGVHGVGSGQVVGTLNNQSLYNKTIISGTFNGSYNSQSTGIVTVVPTTIGAEIWGSGWDDFGKLPDAKTVKDTIKKIAANADVGTHELKTRGVHGVDDSISQVDATPNNIVGRLDVQTLENKTIIDPIIHIGGDRPWIKFKKSYNSGTAYESAERYLHGIDTVKSGSNYLTPTKYSELSGAETMAVSSKTLQKVLADLFKPSYYNQCTKFVATTLNNGTQGLLLRTNSIVNSMTSDNIKFLSEVSLISKQINSTSISQPESVVVLKLLSKGIYNIIFSGSCNSEERDSDMRIVLSLSIFKTVQSNSETLNISETDIISLASNSMRDQSRGYNSDNSVAVSVTCSAIVKVDSDNTWISFRQIGENVQSNQFNVVINRTSPLL